jgi:hypothetical protein
LDLFQGTSQLQPLDLGILNAFKCYFRKQLIWSTVAMIDGGLLLDAIQMKQAVLSAMGFTAKA